MNERIYSQAFIEALRNGTKTDKALSRLRDVLDAHGHGALYGTILRQVLALLQKESVGQGLEIILARAEDQKRFKEEIAALTKTYDKTHTTVRVDESLIGGFIGRTGTQEIDQSYKSALLTIYRSLTA